MFNTRRLGAAMAAAALVTTGLLATSAGTASAHHPRAIVLLEGLSSPKGLSNGSNRFNPVVAQGAFGPPGPVLEYIRFGPQRGTTVEVSPAAPLIDVAVHKDGSGWGLSPTDETGTAVGLFRQAPDGTVALVLNITEYQAGDPDPYDVDGDPEGSNPYGLAALPNGDVLVADAQNNDLLRVSPDGTVVTVARFHPEVVSTDHIPDFAGPTELPAEAVPTGIAIGRDGFAYVSELKGFPFRPGSSNVWRVNPWGHDLECDATAPTRRCSVARTGFTALVDVAINVRTRQMYVYSLGEGGVPAFEEGFATGVFPPAVLLEVGKRGHTRELARGLLSQPGGVVVSKDGAVFVTDNVFTEFGGRLLRVRS